MTSQTISFTVEDLDSLLHKLRGIARKYYDIDEEDTEVEHQFLENKENMPRDLFPLLSWSNSRICIPIEILEYHLKKMIEPQIPYERSSVSSETKAVGD